MSQFKIHPAIGVARVGNSDDFFVGPEHPGVPGNWDNTENRSKSFRDSTGKILRQAARFRIFEFDDTGKLIGELAFAGGAKVRWTVHVANRKASFFTFNGQSGNETDPPYEDRFGRPAVDIEKKNLGIGQPERKNRRNAGISDRRSLEIDPDEVSIDSPGRAILKDQKTASPVKELGEIQMESDGSLLFLGGRGVALPASSDTPPIDEYANNDGWFDDMSDGVVRAAITLPNGSVIEAEPSWVIVGPPKFVPALQNVVSLLDLLWDMAVRFKLPWAPGDDLRLADLLSQQQAWDSASNEFAANYEPSFRDHIYPILSKALAVQDVHKPVQGSGSYHATLADWPLLSQKEKTEAELARREVFRWIRDPNATQLNRKGMPRGLGDDFTALDEFESDRENAPIPPATAFLSLTKVQYALLKSWVAGRFKDDWTLGVVRFAPIPVPAAITPAGLDIAALENCVGGPFYPGIEVSWLIKQKTLFKEAFRLREPGFTLGQLRFEPGFFSQQMALPWQADFYDCHKEEHSESDDETLVYMWWTAQRPDDIRATADGELRRWVKRFDAANSGSMPEDPDHLSNLARFEQMRSRWSELSFITRVGDSLLEEERPAGAPSGAAEG